MKEVFDTLFYLRNLVLPKLEDARMRKLIGKALDAKVIIPYTGDAERFDDWVTASSHRQDFQTLIGVSQLIIWDYGSAETPESANGLLSLEEKDNLLNNSALGGYLIKVVHADGQKCERCWHWETDIDPHHPKHPTICGRCIRAVEANADPQRTA